MDSFEFNKIAGAVLGTALVVFGLNELSKIIYHAPEPEKQGYAIEVAEAAGSGAAAEAPAAPAEAPKETTGQASEPSKDGAPAAAAPAAASTDAPKEGGEKK